MSDIRFNRWLHQSGTGGVYQDSSGNIGIGTSVPTSALDVQSGTIKIGNNTLSSSGISTFNNVVVGGATTALVVTGNARVSGIVTVGTGGLTVNGSTNSITGVTTVGVSTVYVTVINDGAISGARNRIINGDMRIDQRNNGASVTVSTDPQYTLDRWAAGRGTVPNFTIIRSGSVPSNVGFTSSLLATMGNGTAPGSTGYAYIGYLIEGYNVADLNLGTSGSKAFTLSFWVNCSVSGTFGISFRNSKTISNATYCSTYTINSTNTWEYKTVTVPAGAINTGTWLIDNGSGLELYWDLGVGTLYSGTAGQMNTGANYFGVTGTTKLSSTTGATFYITGVQLEAGTVATPFERRSYGQELALCQRYYRKFTSSGSTYTAFGNGISGSSTVINRWGFSLDPLMRASPTVSFTNCVGWNGSPIGGSVSVLVTYNTINLIDVDLNTSGLTNAILPAKVLILSNGYIELTGAEL